MDGQVQGTFEFCRNFPIRPRRPERLFFALFPDPEASLCFERFGRRFVREHRFPGKLLPHWRFHVSLHHVGDYKRLRSGIIYAAGLAGPAASIQPFDITFRSIASFAVGRPDRYPLVLIGEGDGLYELHRILGGALAKNGFRTVEHFAPHMTLLYGPERLAAQPIEPIGFTATAFVLVHSRLWLSQYEFMERWPLQYR